MRRVSVAELAHGLVELFGPLEVADVIRAGDDHELRVRGRLFERGRLVDHVVYARLP